MTANERPEPLPPHTRRSVSPSANELGVLQPLFCYPGPAYHEPRTPLVQAGQKTAAKATSARGQAHCLPSAFPLPGLPSREKTSCLCGCFRSQGEAPGGPIQVTKATNRRKVIRGINIRRISPAPPNRAGGKLQPRSGQLPSNSAQAAYLDVVAYGGRASPAEIAVARPLSAGSRSGRAPRFRSWRLQRAPYCPLKPR